jgi:hypothetical protein
VGRGFVIIKLITLVFFINTVLHITPYGFVSEKLIHTYNQCVTLIFTDQEVQNNVFWNGAYRRWLQTIYRSPWKLYYQHSSTTVAKYWLDRCVTANTVLWRRHYFNAVNNENIAILSITYNFFTLIPKAITAKQMPALFSKYFCAETILFSKLIVYYGLERQSLMLRTYLYRVYHLQCNPKTIMYYGTKMKSEVGPTLCNRLSQPPLSRPGHRLSGLRFIVVFFSYFMKLLG